MRRASRTAEAAGKLTNMMMAVSRPVFLCMVMSLAFLLCQENDLSCRHHVNGVALMLRRLVLLLRLIPPVSGRISGRRVSCTRKMSSIQETQAVIPYHRRRTGCTPRRRIFRIAAKKQCRVTTGCIPVENRLVMRTRIRTTNSVSSSGIRKSVRRELLSRMHSAIAGPEPCTFFFITTLIPLSSNMSSTGK